jgi:primosomal protein N' (replication factor Y)
VKASEGAYVNVIVDQPGRGLSRTFSYLPPKSHPRRVRIGSYVLVPFGPQRLPGFVVGRSDEGPPVQAKRILGLLVDEPLFGETELRQAEWLAEEYYCSLGDALRCYLPPGSTRNVRRRVVLTTEAELGEVLRQIGSRAPSQRAVVEALFAAGGELSLEALAAELGAEPSSALRALEERGIAEVRRELGSPAASTKTRRMASRDNRSAAGGGARGSGRGWGAATSGRAERRGRRGAGPRRAGYGDPGGRSTSAGRTGPRR